MKALIILALLVSFSVQAKEFVEEHNEVTESVVLFDKDKSKVSGDGVKKLKGISQGKTEIIGSASSEGDVEYNLRLSARRANAVHFIMDRPAIVTYVGEENASTPIDVKDRKVLIRVTATELVYNPIYGGYDVVYGPIHHLQWNTIPKK